MARQKTEKLTAIVVDFERKPKIVQIKRGYEELQRIVGGTFSVVYPFADEVGLVVNDEGKLLGLPLNRSLRIDGELRDQGEVYDIIAGKFLVLGIKDDGWCDLSEELQAKFMARFATPECFLNIGGRTRPFPIKSRLVSQI